MSDELILLDLPGKAGKAWSPNTWKVRAVLNYKKIPYKTEWVEFPDIEPKLKELGLSPNPEGSFAPYTVPVVKFPDGSVVMDSLLINQRLVSEYPEPKLPMEWDICEEQKAVDGKVLGPLMPFIMPRARRDVIGEASMDWFKKDRERRFGAPEEQYEKEKGGDVAWNAAKPGQEQLAAFLKEHKRDDGPFLTGSQVSYPDFIAASRCEFLKYIGDDAYEQFVGPVEGLRELHQACQPWFERNDH